MPMKLELPTSKSMTQRALIIAALADGPTRIERPLDCDDSRHLVGALGQLGCAIDWQPDAIAVQPAPLVAPEQRVLCGNAGTAVRFGSCLSLLCAGALTIDGDEHMRGRPIGALGEALSALGVDVRYLRRDGCPPLRLERTRPTPAAASVDTSLSSQYASGLLLVAPRLPGGLVLTLRGDTVSQPYLDMTIAMMQRAGASVTRRGQRIEVEPGSYVGGTTAIETDWSAAAFLLAAERISGIELQLVGLPPAADSLQGDAAFADMLSELGRPAAHHFDLTDTPDLIAPLTAACLFADHPSHIRGAAHTRIKETDRLQVLCEQLGQLGAQLVERPDGMDITPLTEAQIASAPALELDPDDDHRMAMTFGIVSLRVPGIRVKNPSCVSKSFPGFWRVLSSLTTASQEPS